MTPSEVCGKNCPAHNPTADMQIKRARKKRKDYNRSIGLSPDDRGE